MKNKLTLMLASSFLLFPFSPQVHAEQSLKVLIDNKPIMFEQAPIVVGDVTMVPMRDIFEELGAEVKWDATTQSITAKKNDITIQLKIGSTYGLKNYEQVQLSSPPMIKNGHTLVPLRFISESFGNEVSFDQQTGTIKMVSTQIQEEKEAEGSTLTLEQAIQWAENQSYDLKTAEQDIERNNISLENASDQLDYVPIGQGNGEDDNAVRSAYKKVSSATINYEMSKKETEVTKDQITYNTMATYYDIFSKENNLQEMEESLLIAKLDEQAAIAKAERGKISEAEKNDFINARIQSEQDLETANNQLKDSQIKLNQLLGKPIDTIYKLTDKPTYSKPDEIEIESYITRIQSSSPSVWLLEKQIELAELDVNLYTYNSGNSYDLEEMDVNTAELSLAKSKQQMAENIRSMYSSLLQLENQYNQLQVDLIAAEQDYKMNEAKFEKGKVTALEVKKALHTVDEKKRELEQITVEMNLLHFTLDKPWVNG
ncbi:stalk domain-containing protein [Schinkia sp. CFF1]